jgi:hypothetical protein
MLRLVTFHIACSRDFLCVSSPPAVPCALLVLLLQSRLLPSATRTATRTASPLRMLSGKRSRDDALPYLSLIGATPVLSTVPEVRRADHVAVCVGGDWPLSPRSCSRRVTVVPHRATAHCTPLTRSAARAGRRVHRNALWHVPL